MPIVTVSRGTQSGGRALADLLAKRLQCPSIGLEIIKDAASLYGISETAISEQLKQGPQVIERLLGEKRRLYLIALESALVDRALQGDFVYHGLAGHFLLQGVPTVFKVRLVAPLSYRVRLVRERKVLSEEEAIRYIEKIDEKRREWAMFLYNVDWTSASLYDAVINLEQVSLETAAGMIMHALAQPEFKDTPEKRQAIKDLALAKRIRARLALHQCTRCLRMEVRACEGMVSIAVSPLSSSSLLVDVATLTEDEIVDVARSVPGVKNLTVVFTEKLDYRE